MKLTRNQRIAFWTILLLQLLLLLTFVFLRLIDYDEGLYLFYSQLVCKGNLPYVDFFYPQTPYLPYAYAVTAHGGFGSLFLGRLISALVGLSTSVILFLLIYKLTQDATSSLTVFFLYAFNGLTITWHSVVKTHAFSDFFGLLSFSCLTCYLLSSANKRRLWIFLAGLFVGVTVGFRLVLLPLFFVYGAALFVLPRVNTVKCKVIHLLHLLLGTAVGSALTIYLFIRDPSAFLFGNLGYHLLWGNQVINMTLIRRLLTLGEFVLYPQDALILALAAVGTMTLVRTVRGRRPEAREQVVFAAAGAGVILMATALTMSPSQFQYYQQALPYLLICSIPVLLRLAPRIRMATARTGLVGASYLALVVPFVIIFLLGVRQRNKPCKLNTVRTAVQAIQENSRDDDLIFTAWPGYAFLSQRRVEPGLETWGGGVIPFLSSREVARFKMVGDEQVERILATKEPTVVVEEDWFPPEVKDLIRRNYRLAGSTPFVEVYVVNGDR
jgi:4-amino-4-deoxy-L-arabinose transferase-like glycosyltransferase